MDLVEIARALNGLNNRESDFRYDVANLVIPVLAESRFDFSNCEIDDETLYLRAKSNLFVRDSARRQIFRVWISVTANRNGYLAVSLFLFKTSTLSVSGYCDISSTRASRDPKSLRTFLSKSLQRAAAKAVSLAGFAR